MTQSVDEAIQDFAPALPLGVALSGGADSVALLVACHDRWPGQVHALHVHHGLQRVADDFEQHCEQLCTTLSVPLHRARVDARHGAGQSPEDAARQARYAALEVLALQSHTPICSIALAQHADDQVETLLLALSRGAGVPGLAAMPSHWTRAGLQWHRPLLRVAGADVRSWLVARHVQWIEDPTNTDERFTRNRIRRQLVPALQSAFPAFRDTFTRSADHAAQASELLREMAEQDMRAVGLPPGIAALRRLSRARQANVLRHWLRAHHQTTPATAQLSELLDQLAACTTRGHRICIKVGRGFVVREGDALGWYN